ncbi:hypothetical protein JCM15765_15060 [Paradesulfitobacterium aromaticivorans]
MRWSEEQTAKLKELCLEGLSNKEIAATLGCRVEDVYNKRSQLGITIDKCKGMAPNPEFEAALPKPKKRGMHKDVKQAFDALNNSLLVAVARDETSIEQAKTYSALSRLVLDIKNTFDALILDE